ncbi:radical SAM family heme chaperone HemW [Pseudochryseolinea flava]|uniref:Heme chaperone HemW n=1 Tax=Pseudochryseolinea flava TaxID=2059302 RepID=A0A364YAB0_9BACT|nr:radical SAM family heme chaperone HemW [Pseudochryseolinea flava]RAW03335.1 coproporphyrinogen III oxidase [Pseudochryseolinea flava]
MAGIYLHIPFCKQSCHYCDFHFSTKQDQKTLMVQAIDQELVMQKSYLENERIQTIYFGGGTPSLLTREELEQLLLTIRAHYDVDEHSEITIEANPDDLTEFYLREIQSIGINRLSIGIQSFDDGVLQYLNRAHQSAAAKECVQSAQRAGFNNISIDLIYAIPGQDHSRWIKNIHDAIALQPQHISAYALTIEEKTAFGKWAKQGKLSIVDDEIAATQLEILIDELATAGYAQYEVSNFSLAGCESKHNSSYWKQQKYLGVGPSAHSYNSSSRQFNISNNPLYLKAIAGSEIPATVEVLTNADNINDYLMTTLRTAWGTDLSFLKDKWGYDLKKEQHAYIESLLSGALARLENGKLILTKRGKLLADKISSDLFVIPEEG